MILEELGPDIIGIVICRESASKCQVADNKIEWPGRTDRHRREERCYKKVVELSLASVLSLARLAVQHSPLFIAYLSHQTRRLRNSEH